MRRQPASRSSARRRRSTAAVAHAERDVHRRPADPLGQHAAQRVALAPRDDQQRRALVGPYRRVELRRLARPEGEDEQVEDQPPQQPRQLDHPRVGQELPQVGPQRPGGRRLRRPQVGQQHPHRRHLTVLEPALSDVLHGRGSLSSDGGRGRGGRLRGDALIRRRSGRRGRRPPAGESGEGPAGRLGQARVALSPRPGGGGGGGVGGGGGGGGESGEAGGERGSGSTAEGRATPVPPPRHRWRRRAARRARRPPVGRSSARPWRGARAPLPRPRKWPGA